MTSHTAVSVDDNLATGQAGIAHRATDNKLARRVNQQLQFIGNKTLAQVSVVEHPIDDVSLNLLGDPLLGDIRVVLRGHHNGVQVHRVIVFVVSEGDLSLTIRSKRWDDPFLAYLRQAASQAVRQCNR